MGLSTISEQFKKTIVWLGLGLLALAAIWLLWLFLSFVWRLVFPPPPVGPNLLYGSISQPFEYNFNSKNTIFELDVPGGALENKSKILPVYAVPVQSAKLASLDEAKKIAVTAGLDSQPSKLSEFDWRFGSQRYPNKSLKINIVTKNFNFSYDWLTDASTLTGSFKTTDQAMIAKAKSTLSSFRSLKPDLKSGTGQVSYYKLVGKDFNQVNSYSEANAVRVELFRDKVSYKGSDYPVFEPNSSMSLVNILFAPKNLLEVNFSYWDVDFSKTATYTIKSQSQAFDDLRSGKAFVQDTNQKFETITITDVKLGYLNPADSQARYFQPVYNLEGDGQVNGEKTKFQAFVLAVIDDYIK